ncbi:MAG: sulfatase-like hydrolase/transferase [Rhizobacter sp.]|nr:sulfatase-like hydrolase/transferase [Ferruginibacter sp.]
MQDYIACVASIDESVGNLLNYLDKNNLGNNSLVIYTGDQNFIWEKIAGSINALPTMYL